MSTFLRSQFVQRGWWLKALVAATSKLNKNCFGSSIVLTTTKLRQHIETVHLYQVQTKQFKHQYHKEHYNQAWSFSNRCPISPQRSSHSQTLTKESLAPSKFRSTIFHLTNWTLKVENLKKVLAEDLSARSTGVTWPIYANFFLRNSQATF